MSPTDRKARSSGSTLYLFWKTIMAPVWRAWWNDRDDMAIDADGHIHRIIESPSDEEVATILRRVRQRLNIRRPSEARVSWPRVAVLIGAATLTAWSGVQALAWPAGRMTGLMFLFMASIFGFSTWVYIRRKQTLLRWWPIEQVRDAWVAEGGCPACGYGLPKENASEGIVACTECGARWKRSAPDLTP